MTTWLHRRTSALGRHSCSTTSRHSSDLPSSHRPRRDRIVADTKRPVALYESGFAPRWYVPRADIDESALIAVDQEPFALYKGLCSYYDIGDARQAAGRIVRRTR